MLPPILWLKGEFKKNYDFFQDQDLSPEKVRDIRIAKFFHCLVLDWDRNKLRILVNARKLPRDVYTHEEIQEESTE
jgi:hypothetical protein